MEIQLPGRKFTTEFMVGLFMLLGVFALGYQAVGLGGMALGSSDHYFINAEFDNIAGLKNGAAVEIAGVGIGEVAGISLKDPEAMVRLKIRNGIQIRDDDVASIRTKGIIGDRYVKISRGASNVHILEGETIIETESAVDIEDIIGKIVHSLDGGDEE
jgi:phospholipid/cholesterol/gamma-HCH transport system substrate-binding protein